MYTAGYLMILLANQKIQRTAFGLSCQKSETARLMFANSEFLLLFNQAATDRAELSKLLHISDTQLSYITNAEAGHGLLRMGGSIVPFVNTIPRDTELYKLMTTTPGEAL